MSGPETSETSAREVTALLQAWNAGDEGARDKLIPLLYRELHALAHHYMAGEQQDATLQTTALVNELYVRLVDIQRIGWTGRTHFFAVCAQLMRRVLVDVARSRKAAKRGGHAVHVPMDEQRAQRGARGTDAQTGAQARCPTSTRGHRMTVNDLRTNR